MGKLDPLGAQRGVPADNGRTQMAGPTKLSIPARIVVVAPPAGVAFALQRGRRELGPAVRSAGSDLRFDFTLLASRGPGVVPRFSGEFVQGPADRRFVYVTSGTLAGQADSCWTRRAKVPLHMLSWAIVERVASEPNSLLQARIAGVARDGGPACATVPLLDEGWMMIKGTAGTPAAGQGIEVDKEIKAKALGQSG